MSLLERLEKIIVYIRKPDVSFWEAFLIYHGITGHTESAWCIHKWEPYPTLGCPIRLGNKTKFIEFESLLCVRCLGERVVSAKIKEYPETSNDIEKDFNAGGVSLQ